MGKGGSRDLSEDAVRGVTGADYVYTPHRVEGVGGGCMCNRHPRNGSNLVSAVAFNPKNPGQLASASWDNTVKIWTLEDGQCQQTLQGHS